MPTRAAMPVRWRRLIAAGLAWLLVAQAMAWSTHALTHLHQHHAPWNEGLAVLGAGGPGGSGGGTAPADIGRTYLAEAIEAARAADSADPVGSRGGDGGGSLPAEQGCGLCGALNQGSLALISWPVASLSAPSAAGSAAPIDLNDGYARPPVHHPSRAPPVPFHAV